MNQASEAPSQARTAQRARAPLSQRPGPTGTRPFFQTHTAIPAAAPLIHNQPRTVRVKKGRKPEAEDGAREHVEEGEVHDGDRNGINPDPRPARCLVPARRLRRRRLS